MPDLGITSLKIIPVKNITKIFHLSIMIFLFQYTGWSPDCKNVYQAVEVKTFSQSKHEFIVQPLCYLMQQIPEKHRLKYFFSQHLI